MLKLIIFDCDGVMFDSKQANIEYYNHLLDHFGYPAMNADEIDYVHMHNVMDSIVYIFRHYPSRQVEAVNKYRSQVDYTPFLHFMRIEEDLIEFLDTVKNRFHLAISTNRTNTMQSILELFDLQKYFGKVITAFDVENPKPAPDALLEILNHFDCKADEAIYIGDSIIDQQHTQSCGMQLIGFKNPDLEAHFHVNSFMKILDLEPFINNIP